MSKLRDAAQKALEALKKSHTCSNSDSDLDKHSEAIHALRTALAEQPAEPVAWCDQHESHIDGLRHYSDGSSREIPLYTAPNLVRAQVLEEAAGVTGEFAQKWWSMHCASNKHMETTRKAHDDFCALQAAIRALKEKP